MGSSVGKKKGGLMTGSKLAKVGMADSKSGNCRTGQGNTSYSNMKK